MLVKQILALVKQIQALVKQGMGSIAHFFLPGFFVIVPCRQTPGIVTNSSSHE